MKTTTKIGSIAAVILGLASPLFATSPVQDKPVDSNPVTKLYIEDATNYMSCKESNQLDPYQIDKYYKVITKRMAELRSQNNLEEQTWKEFRHMLNMLGNLGYVHESTDGGPIYFRIPALSKDDYKISSVTYEFLGYENLDNTSMTNSISTNKRVQDFMRNLTAQLTNNAPNNIPDESMFDRKSATNIIIQIPPIILTNNAAVTQEVDISRYMEMTTERLKSITDQFIETPPLDSITGQTIKSNIKGGLDDFKENIKENIVEPIKNGPIEDAKRVVINSEYFTNSITRQNMSIEDRLDAIDGITHHKDMYTEEKIKACLCHVTAIMLARPEELKGYTGRVQAYMYEIEEQYTKNKIPNAAKTGMDKAKIYLVPLLKIVRSYMKQIEKDYDKIN